MLEGNDDRGFSVLGAPPEGTRFTLPDEAAARTQIVAKLQRLFGSWGYALVDTPVLERYDPAHPRAAQSFKLSDRDSDVLALRSDFTPAIAHLVRSHGDENAPQRFQYCGKAWQAINPDVARAREFTQLGLELTGISSPKADAELIHLAREAVREVGLVPRVEIGNPGFVRALFDLAEVPEPLQETLADTIDRKDVAGLEKTLEGYGLEPDLKAALLSVADLYGDVSILSEARQLAPWSETLQALDNLEAILAEFEDVDELLLDFGRARRLSYYTGVTFQAYTFDFGQPLLGGGRYDGALLPFAAGFTIGLERLLLALPPYAAHIPPLVLSLDDIGARRLRGAGYCVERSLSSDVDEAKAYALARGIAYLLTDAGLEPVTEARPEYKNLMSALETSYV